MLVDAGISHFEGFGCKIVIPPRPLTAPAAPIVAKDPIQAQLAERRPDYARVFPQGFPMHGTPTSKQAE